MEQKCNECEHCAIGHWKQIPSKVEAMHKLKCSL